MQLTLRPRRVLYNSGINTSHASQRCFSIGFELKIRAILKNQQIIYLVNASMESAIASSITGQMNNIMIKTNL